jgi:hypothetical protein
MTRRNIRKPSAVLLTEALAPPCTGFPIAGHPPESHAQEEIDEDEYMG